MQKAKYLNEVILLDCSTVARTLAEEAIVLLKNENDFLPLHHGEQIAIFGRTQEDTIFSGNGSGAAHFDGGQSFLTAFERAGLCPEPGLREYYREQIAAGVGCQEKIDWSMAGECVNSGLVYELFGKYLAPAEELPISAAQLEQAKRFSDTAILLLGRNSGGEECDRHLNDDYYLTASEKALADQVCDNFENVVLILNVNGLIDLRWTEEKKAIKSILFVGIPGEQGAPALANILMGRVNPSGKLAFTVAREFSDYPAADHFTWDKDNEKAILTYESYGLKANENGSKGFSKSPVTVYHEDIYAGYRYFDSFGVEPLFPFGFGLSYTSFQMECIDVSRNDRGITLTVRVKNTGTVPGKETVQVYLAAHSGMNRPLKELKGFEKTKILASGEYQDVGAFVPWRELSCYQEGTAAYEIDPGNYQLLVGNSSHSLAATVNVEVPKRITVLQCANRLGLRTCNRDKLEFLSAPTQKCIPQVCPWSVTLEEIAPENQTTQEEQFRPVAEKLSMVELAALCVGYGPGVPFSAFLAEYPPETITYPDGTPVTFNSHPTGVNGYVSPAIPQKEILSVFYKDGPAGIGETAWPTEMLIACAFNKELWYAFGNAVGTECEKQQVDVWLAPAVNLQRNPLGGRNFEYFSEDPLLTGICACSVTRGVQENHPVLVCPKHFAVNEQETFRRGSGKRNYDAVDSILTERAARELYLKPFEMLVKDAGVMCLMTSFNKINGTFAGGNKDLCTHILREEWGFEGVVVTDWGDMDIVVDGADAVAAGNDVIMPGGPPVIAQILRGVETGAVTRQNIIQAVNNLLNMVARTSAGAKKPATHTREV